jgi:uncharacterized membrane protein YidH (DUF202 family)
MTPDQRITLAMARTGHFYFIVGTSLALLTALAGIIHLGPGGNKPMLGMLVIAAASYGIIAGSTALRDVANLTKDADEATARTHYGRTLAGRNFLLLALILAATLGAAAVTALHAFL